MKEQLFLKRNLDISVKEFSQFRESSFNLTGGDDDIEGAPNIFRHPKVGL